MVGRPGKAQEAAVAGGGGGHLAGNFQVSGMCYMAYKGQGL